MPRWLPWASALAVACSALPAMAQTPADIAAARRWFKEGEQAEQQGDYPLALDRFGQALAVKETPQLLLRIGACQEQLGRLVAATGSYERALAKAREQALPQVAGVAEEQLQALLPRVPTVVVLPAEPYPGLKVTLDGAPVAAAALSSTIPVDPGAHTLVGEAAGRARRDLPFTAAEGSALRLALDLGPALAKAPPPPAPSPLPAYLLVGGGWAAVAGGVALVGVSLAEDRFTDGRCGGAERKACPSSQKDAILSAVTRANALRFSGIGLGGLGLAGAAVGTYLLLAKPRPAASATGKLFQVAPIAGPGALGVTALGQF